MGLGGVIKVRQGSDLEGSGGYLCSLGFLLLNLYILQASGETESWLLSQQTDGV